RLRLRVERLQTELCMLDRPITRFTPSPSREELQPIHQWPQPYRRTWSSRSTRPFLHLTKSLRASEGFFIQAGNSPALFCDCHFFGDGVEHAVDEVHRLRRGKLARDLESLVDDHRLRSLGVTEEFRNA